jgi:hypothetical protein
MRPPGPVARPPLNGASGNSCLPLAESEASFARPKVKGPGRTFRGSDGAGSGRTGAYNVSCEPGFAAGGDCGAVFAGIWASGFFAGLVGGVVMG